MEEEKIKQIIKSMGIKLVESHENIVSVGLAYKEVGGQKTNQLCLQVGVIKKLKKRDLELLKIPLIPKQILGVVTDVIEIGEIQALEYNQRMRPCPGGISVGHIDITAGTVGLPQVYTKEGELCFLSNNHVLANANEGTEGDAILQPGSYDGGHISKDQLATLHSYVAINWVDPSECTLARGYAALGNSISQLFNRRTKLYTIVEQPNPNLVDAAIAKPLQVPDMAAAIIDIGKPEGVNFTPELGMKVQKTGRTTQHTTGEITQLFATITVGYSQSMLGKRAIFTDQIITSKMGAPGDSGSSMFDMDKYCVGLLFAGSDEATVFNTIHNVFELLEVELE